MAIPSEHIADSHKLIADGRIDLYALTPSGTTGTIYFKDENPVTYRGISYTGLPIQLAGEKKTADSGLTMPTLTIGQPNIDLSLFKPLLFDGWLDNAIIVRTTVLLDNMLNNRDIKEVTTYRVKRVMEYSRFKIELQLATVSDSLGFSLPIRTYLPPAFPAVQM